MIKNIDELLSDISTNAIYYAGLDSDFNLVTIAAGGNVPYIASWDKEGYRPYVMYSNEDYHPVSRERFIQLVKEKNPLI